MEKQVRVLFSGNVQGVGFRYTAERLARRYPISGYVKNLPNGKVELVAEGEEKSLEKLVKEVSESFKSYVQNVEKHWGKPTGGHEGFGIKF